MKTKQLYYGLAWIILAVSAITLIQRITLNSDSLFLDALVNDVFVQHGYWADWRLTPAPAYAPDILLYLIAYPFFSSAVLRILFVSFCQVFILAALSLWCARKISPSLSTTAKTGIVVFLAFVNLVATHSGMWLYFYTTNNHFAVLVFALLVLGWLLRFIEKPTWALGFGIMIGTAVAKISSAIFIIGFLAPVLTTCLLILVTIGRAPWFKPFRARLFQVIGLLLLAFVLAHMMDWMLTYHAPLDGRVPLSITAAGYSLTILLKSLVLVFKPDNIYTFLLTLVIVLSMIGLIINMLMRIKIRIQATNNPTVELPLSLTPANQIDWKLASCGLLLAIMFPMNIVGAVISGGLLDTGGARYFTAPIALTLLLTFILLDRYSHKVTQITQYWRSMITVALFIIMLLTIYTAVSVFSEQSLDALIQKDYQNDRGETAVANCITQLRAKHIPLKAGIADYWFARSVSLRLPDRVPIESTLNDLSPFFWMSTVGPYSHPENYAPRLYNFIIVLPTNPPDGFNYDSENLRNVLPKGYTSFSCPNTQISIWFYPNNALDTLIKNKQAQLLSQRQFRKPKGFCKEIHRC